MVDRRNRLRLQLWVAFVGSLVIGNLSAFVWRDTRFGKTIVLGLCCLITFGLFPLLKSKMHVLWAVALTALLYFIQMAYAVVLSKP